MQHLDEIFNTEYNSLIQVAKGILFRAKRKHQPEDIVSEAYIYIKTRHPHLTNRTDILKLALAFIRNEITNHRSKTNYVKTLQPQIEYTENIPEQTDESQSLEAYYHAIETYLSHEPDNIQRITNKVFVDQGKRTARSMAQHFDIHPKYALQHINTLKKKVNLIFNAQMEAPKLKEQWKGLMITRVIVGVGHVTFDTTKVDPSHYYKFITLFPDLFEESTPQPEQIAIEVPKTGTQPKSKPKKRKK